MTFPAWPVTVLASAAEVPRSGSPHQQAASRTGPVARHASVSRRGRICQSRNTGIRRCSCSTSIRAITSMCSSSPEPRSLVAKKLVHLEDPGAFGEIPHSGLMSAIEERIFRPPRAQAPARDVARRGDAGRDGHAGCRLGTPQGGVLSPCLCNVYLHRLDRQWAERGTGFWWVTRTICWRCAGPRRRPKRRSRRSADPGRTRARAQGRQDQDRAP